MAQTEFPIIEFEGDTFKLLLNYLHTGCCNLSCLNIPGLICAAEHYDLPGCLTKAIALRNSVVLSSISLKWLEFLGVLKWNILLEFELVADLGLFMAA